MKAELSALGLVALIAALMAALFSLFAADTARPVEAVVVEARSDVLVPGVGVPLRAEQAQAPGIPHMVAGGSWHARALPGVDRLAPWQQLVLFLGYPFAFALVVLFVGLAGGALALAALWAGRRVRWGQLLDRTS